MEKNFCFESYKSFQDNNEVMRVKPLNVLIGRNNSGKSSLLDILGFCINFREYNDRSSEVVGLSYFKKLTEKDIAFGFSKTTSGGRISGNHYQYGCQFLSKELKIDYNLSRSNENSGQTFTASTKNLSFDLQRDIKEKWDRIATTIGNPFAGNSYLRVFAERDVKPENDTADLNCYSDGTV